MKKCWHTICFTYKDKIKSMFFILSTVILILAIAIAMNFSQIQKVFSSGDKPTKSTQIIVNNLSKTYIIESQWLEELFKDDNIVMIKDKKEAETELNKGIESIMLRIEDNPESIYKISILTKKHSNASNIELLQQYSKKLALYSKLKEFKVQDQIHEPLLMDVKMEVTSFETNAESKMALAYFVILAFVVLLTFYVQGVSNIIAYEKSSRVIEVLLTSSKPRELFFGKVVGNCLATLTQISIIGIAAWLINSVSNIEPIKIMGTQLDISVLTIKQIVYICILFILGYLLYSLAAGALASLVTNSEDVNQVILPVNLCYLTGVALSMYSYEF